MARSQDTFVLKLIADINQALGPLQKFIALVNGSNIPEDLILDIVVNPGNFNKLKDIISTFKVSKKTADEFLSKVNEIISGLRTANPSSSLFKDATKDIYASVLQLEEFQKQMGLLQQLAGGNLVVPAFIKAQKTISDLLPLIKRVEDAFTSGSFTTEPEAISALIKLIPQMEVLSGVISKIGQGIDASINVPLARSRKNAEDLAKEIRDSMAASSSAVSGAVGSNISAKSSVTGSQIDVAGILANLKEIGRAAEDLRSKGISNADDVKKVEQLNKDLDFMRSLISKINNSRIDFISSQQDTLGTLVSTLRSLDAISDTYIKIAGTVQSLTTSTKGATDASTQLLAKLKLINGEAATGLNGQGSRNTGLLENLVNARKIITALGKDFRDLASNNKTPFFGPQELTNGDILIEKYNTITKSLKTQKDAILANKSAIIATFGRDTFDNAINSIRKAEEGLNRIGPAYTIIAKRQGELIDSLLKESAQYSVQNSELTKKQALYLENEKLLKKNSAEIIKNTALLEQQAALLQKDSNSRNVGTVASLVAEEKKLIAERESLTSKSQKLSAETQQLETRYKNLLSSINNNIGLTKEQEKEYKNLFNVEAEGTNQEQRRLNIISTLNRALTQYTSANKKAENSISGVNNINELGDLQFRKIVDSVKDFNFFMTIAIEKIIRYRVAFIAMQSAIQALKSTFTIAKDLEHDFAQLAKVLQINIKATESYKQKAFEFSRTFGVGVKDIIEIMRVWAQQGKTQTEINDLTKATILGMTAANLSATDAVETLTAAQRIYNVAGEDSVSIFDKILNVERLFAVTTGDLAESIKLLGITAEEFGINLDSLLGSITAVVQVTRRTGSQVANSLKTIFANLVGDEAIQQLRDVNIAVFDVSGNIRSLDDILKDLSDRWTQLSEAQKLSIAKSVGGVRHYTQFVVLMDQFSTKLAATAASQKALGFTQRASATELGTLDNQIKRITASFTQFTDAIGSSSFGFKSQVKAFADIFEILFNGNKELTSIQKAFAGATGAIISFATAVVAIKAGQVAWNLAMQKSIELMSVDLLGSLRLVSSAEGKLQAQLINGANVRGQQALGLLGAERQQILEVAKLSKAANTGDNILVTIGKGQHTFRKESASSATAAATLENSIGGVIIKSEQAAAASSKFGSILSKLAFPLKGLLAALGGWQGILIAIGLTLLPKIVNGVIDLAKNILHLKTNTEQASQSLQTMVENLNNATDTQGKFITSIVRSGEEFSRFNDLLNDAKASNNIKQQISALGGLSRAFDTLRNTDIRLSSFTNSDLADDSKRQQILSVIFDILNNGTRTYISLQKEASKKSQERLGQLAKERDDISDISKSYSDFQKSVARFDELSVSVSNFTKEQASDLKKINELNNKIARQKSLINDASLSKDGADSIDGLLIKLASLQNTRESLLQNIDSQVLEVIDNFDLLKKSVIQLKQELKSTDTRKNLFKDVEISQEDIDRIDSQIEKALKQVQKDLENGKGINFSSIVSNIDAGNSTQEVGNRLLTIINENFNNTIKISNQLRESIENTKLSIGLTSKEMQKISKEAIENVSKAIVMFDNLDDSVKKVVSSSVAQNKPITFLDALIDQLELVNDQFDSNIKSLDEQKQRLIVQQDLAKRIKFGQDAENLQQALDLQEKILEKTQELDALKQQGIESDNASSKQNAQNIANIQNNLDGLKAKLIEVARSIAPTLNNEEFTNVLKTFIEQSEKAGKITKENRDTLSALIDKEIQQLSGEIAQLEARIKLEKELSSEKRAQTKVALNEARAKRSDLTLIQKSLDIEKDIKEANRSVAIDIIKKLELGHEAIAESLEKQAIASKFQLERQEAIARIVNSTKLTPATQADLIKKASQFSNSWKEHMQEILDAYSAINKDGAKKEVDNLGKLLDMLVAQEQAELSIASIKEKAADITDFTAAKLKSTLDFQSDIIDLSSELDTLLGNRFAKLEAEEKKWQDIQQLQEENRNILKSTADLLKDQLGQDSLLNLKKSADELSDIQKRNVELFGNRFKSAIELVSPILESVKKRAEDIAGALTNAFAGINNIVISRFDAIASKQDEIKLQEERINRLREKAGTLVGVNNDKYEDMVIDIKNAQLELDQLNSQLKNISSTSGLVKNIFGSFAKQLSEVVLSIQTDEMKRALTEVLTDTGVGKTIVSAFMTGSEQGAEIFAKSVRSILEELRNKNIEVFKTSGVEFVNSLDKVLKDNIVKLEQISQSIINSSISGSSSQNTSAQIQSTGTLGNGFIGPQLPTGEDLNSTIQNLIIENNNLSLKNQALEEALSKLKESIDNYRESNSSTTRFLISAIQTLGISLGTALGVKAGGSAAASGIGSSLGSGITQALIGDFIKKKGFGKVASAVLGSTIPVFGSIAGGLLGALFSKRKNPKLPPDQFERNDKIDTNTNAIFDNTEAIRNLTSEFVDLREQFINAPSRFVAPSSVNLGSFNSNQLQQVGTSSRVSNNPGQIQTSQPGLSISFVVNGSFDQNAANQVIDRVSEVYNRQARLNSSNSRIFR